MRMIDYWPSLQNINECIRTEAEELAEYTLLAASASEFAASR